MMDPEGLAFDHAGLRIFTADDNSKKVQRMNMDGSTHEDVVTGLAGLTSVAIDPVDRFVYYSDENSGTIARVSLNADAPTAMPVPVVTGIPQVQGVALDVRNRRIYWADFQAGAIRSADIRGTNLDIRHEADASQPVDVDLDAARCRLWWTDRGSNAVKRVNLQTGNVETVIANTPPALAGLGLDKRATPETVYWVDNHNHRLARADMDPPNSNVNLNLVQLATDKGFDVAVLRLDDSDGDGVPNGLPSTVDLFQCNAAAAGESFSPAQAVFGMLMFEDFWPFGFDHDYNDTVLAYNVQFATTLDGRVSSIRFVLHALAAGGHIDHGVGLVLPVPRGAASSIVKRIGGVATQLTPSPSDANLTFAISMNVKGELFGASANEIVNSLPSVSPRPGQSIEVLIELACPMSLDLSRSPFDIYTFRIPSPAYPSHSSTHEIHGRDYCGTSQMDQTLFGQGVDTSNSALPRCYTDQNMIPSGLQIPVVVDYPAEGVSISSLYPRILSWAASGGTVDADWYLHPNNQPGLAYPTPISPQFPGGVDKIVADTSCTATPRSCLMAQLLGGVSDGIYTIDPDGPGGGAPISVHCDMASAGGGWTRVARLDAMTPGYCGGDPSASYDLSSDPTKTAGKIADSTVRSLLSGSWYNHVMYFTGQGGRSNFVHTTMLASYRTDIDYRNHCAWTCADGSGDSTTCQGEYIGCGFSGTGTPGDTKKLYIGATGGPHAYSLHSGGGFCGLDNRLRYTADVYVR